MKKMIFTLATFSLVILATHAQSFSIDWHKIAGAGASSNAQYTVTGTAGQHDAGVAMSGGTFSITGGFGSIFAVQTPGAPLLSIRLTSTDTVMVFWPSASSNFVLQQNDNLSTTNWVAPPEMTSDDTTNKFIIVTPLVGNRFYRLAKP